MATVYRFTRTRVGMSNPTNNRVHKHLRKTRHFRLDVKPQIWVGKMSGTEIRNPTNSLGTRLSEITGFSLNVKYD